MLTLKKGASVPVKADFQNAPIRADQPPSFRTRKRRRPIASHIRQSKPAIAFIWSPCCSSIVGRHNYCIVAALMPSKVTMTSVFVGLHVAQAENSACYGRRV